MLELFILSGCAKRPAASSAIHAQQARNEMRSLPEGQQANDSGQDALCDFGSHNQQEYEARCEDVFIPLGVVAHGYEYDPSQVHITLHYYSTLSQQELIALYISEMERLGWDCEHQFSGHEMVVLFKKPHKICMVSCIPMSRGRMIGQQHLIIRYKNA